MKNLKKLQELFLITSTNTTSFFSSLLFFTLLSGLLEVFSVGMIIPLVNVLQTPEKFVNNSSMSFITELLGISNTTFSVTVLIFSAFLFTIYTKNLLLIFFNNKIRKSYSRQQRSVAKKLFELYLNAPYLFHVNSNTAHSHSILKSELNEVFGGFVQSLVTLVSELLMVLGIATLLFFLSPVTTAISFLIFLIGGYVISSLIKKKSTQLGVNRQYFTLAYNELSLQSLTGIKDIAVNNRYDYFIARFNRYCDEYIESIRSYNVLMTIPRLLLECLAVTVLFIIFFVSTAQNVPTAEIVTIISVFAGGAFKILPSINKIIVAINQLKFNAPAIDKVLSEASILRQSQTSKPPKNESDRKQYGDLVIKGLNYQFTPNNPILKNINICIKAGEVVGIVGKSGSGKSTLLNIIAGLLPPQDGEISVNSENIYQDIDTWKNSIGYVPQDIFMLDDTLENNIKFGLNETDHSKKHLHQVIKESQLNSIVSQLEKGIETNIGERGSKISGGQRQRLGIARALYKKPNFLFFDESTSALDNITENEIMEEIYSLAAGRSVIIVAHRLSTLKKCDRIFVLAEGEIVSCAPFDELKVSCPHFKELYESSTSNKDNINGQKF